MPTPAATGARHAAANRPRASYHATRFDLNEGRDWLVTSAANHSYVVTIWVEEGLGRMASCRCKAFSFGLLCSHIKYAQKVDSILTGAEVREIRPVFVECAAQATAA